MQATVLEFDTTTGDGAVVADDGRVFAFTGEAFASGGLRMLRPGQRVSVELTGDQVASLTIYTLPT